MRMTRVGGPTVLVELRGWRILIDPTFDPPGRRYSFGPGASSRKTSGPAVLPADIGPVDLVLLSHDHHADNLDDAGRGLLPGAWAIVTTRRGAGRLALPQARGLEAGESTFVEAEGRGALEVTATPCRHGPPLSGPIVGAVIGFAIRTPRATLFDLWVTGDTVLYPAVRRFARESEVDVAIVNAGGVRFAATGPLRYSMTGADAVALVTELRPRVAVPAHYDGWSHFRDGPDGMRDAVDRAPEDVRSRFRWLDDGVPTEI